MFYQFEVIVDDSDAHIVFRISAYNLIEYHCAVIATANINKQSSLENHTKMPNAKKEKHARK